MSKKNFKDIKTEDSEIMKENETEEYMDQSDDYLSNYEEENDDEEDDKLDDNQHEIDDEDGDAADPEVVNTETGDQCIYNMIDPEASEDDIIYDIYDEENNDVVLLEGDDRITDDRMTKYEFVRIVGMRAKQISMGSKKFIKDDYNRSSKEIALLELKYNMTPYKIRRPLPNNRYEIWKINELEKDHLLFE